MTLQVNISLEKEDVTILDQMATKAGYDKRSPFIRWLIRKEWSRQIQLLDQAQTQSIETTSAELGHEIFKPI